jgi:hypothetical protein
MRCTRFFCAVVTAIAFGGMAHAVPISLFSDTDTFIDRAEDIVIAECTSLPNDKGIGADDGLYPVEVEVLNVIKGKRALGKLTVATIYPMKAGGRYLLTSSGGSALNTDFLSLAELSVVSLLANASLKELEGKTIKQQVQMGFAWHLHEVEQQLAPLLAEQSKLQRSLKDRDDDVFQAKGKVQIGAVTQSRQSVRSFAFPMGNLEWSHAAPGESGYFYFRTGSSQWEFAPTDETDIQAVHDKPLRATFYGSNSPSRDRRLGTSSPNSINVRVGQIILARTIEKPQSILIIKLVEQSTDEAKLTTNYATIRSTDK